jgi:energy-coupling factor transporter ATPase
LDQLLETVRPGQPRKVLHSLFSDVRNASSYSPHSVTGPGTYIPAFESDTVKERHASLIAIKGLFHRYDGENASRHVDRDYSLKNISLQIGHGERVAVIGANGSGKSTLLRMLNALLLPVSGEVWINDWNTRDVSKLKDIRSTVSMVFQSPETQIVATIVEEDVAFGPENLGRAPGELREVVEWALERVGLLEYKTRPTQHLSAGQKQLLAIASALAMGSRCLLLDEATTSLDPKSRIRLNNTIDELHRGGRTIIQTTHRMEEAALASRVLVLSRGELVMDGDPHSVFSRVEELLKWQLDIPEPMRIVSGLQAALTGFSADGLTIGGLVDGIMKYSTSRRSGGS